MIILVPDGTLGLKRYRARGAIMVGAKQWFLRLLYFQLTPIFLILLTKEMKKGNYIIGRNRQNKQNSFCLKIKRIVCCNMKKNYIKDVFRYLSLILISYVMYMTS